MSRIVRRWRWPVIAGVTLALLFGVVTGLWGEGLGTPQDTTWFQFFIVALGGSALYVLWQTRQDSAAMKQALLGYGDTPGLTTTVQSVIVTVEGLNATLEGVKRWMPEQEGARRTLNQSVSRMDGELREVREVQHRLVAWAEEVGVPLGRPFAYPPDTAFHPRREREAG